MVRCMVCGDGVVLGNVPTWNLTIGVPAQGTEQSVCWPGATCPLPLNAASQLREQHPPSENKPHLFPTYKHTHTMKTIIALTALPAPADAFRAGHDLGRARPRPPRGGRRDDGGAEEALPSTDAPTRRSPTAACARVGLRDERGEGARRRARPHLRPPTRTRSRAAPRRPELVARRAHRRRGGPFGLNDEAATARGARPRVRARPACRAFEPPPRAGRRCRRLAGLEADGRVCARGRGRGRRAPRARDEPRASFLAGRPRSTRSSARSRATRASTRSGSRRPRTSASCATPSSSTAASRCSPRSAGPSPRPCSRGSRRTSTCRRRSRSAAGSRRRSSTAGSTPCPSRSGSRPSARPSRSSSPRCSAARPARRRATSASTRST